MCLKQNGLSKYQRKKPITTNMGAKEAPMMSESTKRLIIWINDVQSDCYLKICKHNPGLKKKGGPVCTHPDNKSRVCHYSDCPKKGNR
jgi:hypothetical protein